MFGSVLTAMVTPMDQDLKINYQEAANLARYLVSHGSDGIIVTGTTGEPPTLNTEERLRLIATVREAVGSAGSVLANIGSYSTAESVELAREAVKLKVDGLMAVVPYYNKPPQEGLYRHFRAIAEAAPAPLIMYNIPGRTGINMLPETVRRLAEVPQIVGIKEAAGSMDQMSELKKNVPAEFAIYSGEDSLTLPMLALGGTGVIGVASHVVGKQVKEMIEAYRAGDPARALRLHLLLYPVFRGIFVTTNPIPIKYILNKMGFQVGGCRLPLTEPSESDKKFLDDLTEQIQNIIAQ